MCLTFPRRQYYSVAAVELDGFILDTATAPGSKHLHTNTRLGARRTESELTPALKSCAPTAPAVAQVVFVRKRLVEIRYFRTTITDEQREEFGQLVDDTIRQIESAQFLPNNGVRFPQNPCTSCLYVGLCLGQQELADATLVRRPGEDLGLFDELTY